MIYELNHEWPKGKVNSTEVFKNFKPINVEPFKSIATPIDQHFMNKLRPAIMKLLTELQVKEVSYEDEKVKFFYLNLEVTIQVKTKKRK